MTESPTWPRILGMLAERADLSVAQSTWAMERIVIGDFSPAQLGAFLIALRTKGETVDEIVGFRDAALAHALPLNIAPSQPGTLSDTPLAPNGWNRASGSGKLPKLNANENPRRERKTECLDIVGTGGDQLGTVNVSTMASVVAAAAGVPVVKFGNRGVSSRSGSSDVLAALGINRDLPPERVAAVFDEVGITFAFAALFLPGFKNAAPVRAELGIPTVFNILGPLCNPARPQASAVGVAHRDRVPLVVGSFQARDTTALVFRGDDGLDELTTTGHSHIWEVSGGSVTEHDFDPRDLGIQLATIDDLRGGDATYNAGIARAVFAGQQGPIRDIVLLNAAAGLVAFDLSQNPDHSLSPILDRFVQKMGLASEAIDSGAASALLDTWVAATSR